MLAQSGEGIELEDLEGIEGKSALPCSYTFTLYIPMAIWTSILLPCAAIQHSSYEPYCISPCEVVGKAIVAHLPLFDNTRAFL